MILTFNLSVQGDDVILLDPYYPQHQNKIELAGAKIILAPRDKANGYRIDADLIEERITSKTKMIALVNPANPTGRVYSYEELKSLADIAHLERDIPQMGFRVPANRLRRLWTMPYF